jgi:hypothetical protein
MSVHSPAPASAAARPVPPAEGACTIFTSCTFLQTPAASVIPYGCPQRDSAAKIQLARLLHLGARPPVWRAVVRPARSFFVCVLRRKGRHPAALRERTSSPDSIRCFREWPRGPLHHSLSAGDQSSRWALHHSLAGGDQRVRWKRLIIRFRAGRGGRVLASFASGRRLAFARRQVQIRGTSLLAEGRQCIR